MKRTRGRLSAERWNEIVEKILEKYNSRVEQLVFQLSESGYPPFTVSLTESEIYDRLLAWQSAGDPRFWNDKEAQAELLRLSLKYGEPPDLTVGPYGVSAPNNPYYQYAAPEVGETATGPEEGTGAGVSG